MFLILISNISAPRRDKPASVKTFDPRRHVHRRPHLGNHPVVTGVHHPNIDRHYRRTVSALKRAGADASFVVEIVTWGGH
jgi:hypothetical protein